jgi:hypothetical protein
MGGLLAATVAAAGLLLGAAAVVLPAGVRLAAALLLASTASAASAAAATALQWGSVANPPEPQVLMPGAAGAGVATAAGAGFSAAAGGLAVAAWPSLAVASIRIEEMQLATLAVAGSASTDRVWAERSLLTLRDAATDCRLLLAAATAAAATAAVAAVAAEGAVAAGASGEAPAGAVLLLSCCAFMRLSWDCCLRYCVEVKAGQYKKRVSKQT